MKFKFRATLLTILLGLLGFVVIALGTMSFWNARKTAGDLTNQILEQLSLRITDRGRHQLSGAAAQVRLMRRELESGRLGVDDFSALVGDWREFMAVRPELARMSFGTASGEWLYLRRAANDRIAVGELRLNGKTGKLEFGNFWADEYPKKRFFADDDQNRQDPRGRVWYRDAVRAGDLIWTDSYVLFGIRGVADMPGITCAAPVFGPDKALRGVVAASIDLYRLCTNLKEMPVGKNGYAFLVELRDDGTRRVIGHPDPTQILKEVRAGGDERVVEMVHADESADPRVQAFLRRVPADLPKDPQLVPVKFVAEGTHYLGGFRHVQPEDGPESLICMLLPEMDIMAQVYRDNWVAVGLGAAVFLVAVWVSLVVSAQVARPIEALVHETELVGHFNVEMRPQVASWVEEVDRLGQATEQMKSSLRSFRKYVPADLVRNLIASGVEARLGGEERSLTIFFCDLAGFTSISEGLAPQALVEQLGEYFRAFTEEVVASGGTVDKYIGDAEMAFWGAPREMANHALAACTAALACQRRLAVLRREWRSQGKPEFYARIGINTGTVVVGNIGSEQRLNYTVIGDPVNVASRLEGLNKFFGTAILISEATYMAAANSIVVRPVDRVSVKGKKEGGLVYELVCLQGEITSEQRDRIEKYSRALKAYERRDWDGAAKLFEELLGSHPGDRASEELLRRCRRFQFDPPPSDWDGVFQMESK